MTVHRRGVLLVAGLSALGCGFAYLESLADNAIRPTAGTYAATVVLAVAVALGRTRPRAGWILALFGLAWLMLSTGHDGSPIVPYLFVWVAVYNAGRRDGSRWSAVSGFGAAAISELISLTQHVDAAGYSILIPFIWFAGRSVNQREVLAGRLEERARELEEEREAYARLSVRYERARVASELHDIVAHAISVMVVQAGAGQRLVDLDAELTRETFAAIGEAARQAEADMGRLVTLLADEDAIGAAPDLSLVEELVQRASGSGLDVALRLEGQREGFPAPTVETAYRVVQESLTNAMRYAAGSRVRILVRGAADELEVEVLNGPAAAESRLAGAGTGNGLRGLRERAAACGGRLEAGPEGDGGWRVSARLPAAGAAASVPAR